jgi:hypothetical protein
MSGDRLATVARRVMRHETYTLIVSPAVADLQRARLAGASAWTMWRLWLGVARAASGALLADVAGDLRGAMRAARDGADRWFALSAAGIALANLLSYYPRLSSVWPETQALLLLALLPSSAAAGIVFGLVPLGRSLARRPACGRREIVAATVVLTAVIFLFLDQGVWRANAAFRAIAINGITGGATTVGEQMAFERTATGSARRRLIPFAASTGALFLLGVALRRRRAVLALVAAGVSLVLYKVLQTPVLSSPLREWLPAIVLYGIALAALARSAPTAPARTQVALP